MYLVIVCQIVLTQNIVLILVKRLWKNPNIIERKESIKRSILCMMQLRYYCER